MSLQEMRNQMEKEGMTFAQFREEIRNEIMMQRLREHEVDAKIQVSDAEIDTYLAAEKAAAAEKRRDGHRADPGGIPANATPEQIAARKRARRRSRAPAAHRRRLRQDRRHLFRRARRAEGRRHRLARPDRLPPLFASRAAQAQPGPGDACHQEQYRLPHPQADRQAQPEKAQRRQQAGGAADPRAPHPAQGHPDHAGRASKKLADLKAKIENKSATFEELARQNSQDSTAAKGGDLGWLEPGDMEAMPEFETAMNALKPGEVSDVVEDAVRLPPDPGHRAQERRPDLKEKERMRRAR
jgi:peptidyl-prolyl cis-trans isomerase SurA